MLASPGPREGKSTILLNLGWAFWQLGHRLIMVDSDLCRPSLHRALRLPRQSGLTDLLTAKASWDQVQRPIKEDFIFLSAGATEMADPGVVLNPERIRAFLDLLTDRADLVLFDSAPVLAVSDNLILASMVDGVILVVRAGHTQQRDLIRAKDQLEKVGARLVGIVINQVSPRETRRYYHQYADYYVSSEAFPPRKSRLNPRSWWQRHHSRHSKEMARRESAMSRDRNRSQRIGFILLLSILTAMLALVPAGLAWSEEEYVIGIDDLLQIQVWDNKDLDQVIPVRPDGKISFRSSATSGPAASPSHSSPTSWSSGWASQSRTQTSPSC